MDKRNRELFRGVGRPSNNINRLEPLKPRFISVTYGAGGSTRENTHDLVKQIKKKTNLQPAAHLTCINSTREEIELIANDYWQSGIKHIVALRGDPPKNSNNIKSDFKYATDLITFLRKKHDFEITVSAYPEIHPDSNSIEQEYDILKKKIDEVMDDDDCRRRRMAKSGD